MLEGLRKDATIVCHKPAHSEPCLPTQEVDLNLYLNQTALYKTKVLLQNERLLTVKIPKMQKVE